MVKLLIKESDDKITANTFQELISKLEKHGYSCGHYYDVRKPDSNWLYITKNGDPYEAEFYKYSDGKYELYLRNIHPTKKDTYEGCGKKKKGSRKLKEGSNFDNVTDAIDYYYGKWLYDEISYNEIEDELERLGHSERFIDAVLDGITQLYDDQERYDYEHDYYDESVNIKESNRYPTIKNPRGKFCVIGRYRPYVARQDFFEIVEWCDSLKDAMWKASQLSFKKDGINNEYWAYDVENEKPYMPRGCDEDMQVFDYTLDIREPENRVESLQLGKKVSKSLEFQKDMKNINMEESYSDDTLYCVVGFDDDKMQSTNFGNATLVAFDNLATAKDFESLIYSYMKDAEWDDELDPECFDVTGGYFDGDDYLSEYRCVGCYTVPVQDILNARNYDPNIIPGKEVVILNQKDLYDQSAMILCNIPDRFYR